MRRPTLAARTGVLAGWLAVLLLVALAAGTALLVPAAALVVEDQFDWVLRSWWFPLQLLLVWLVHARLLLGDYGAERLFWEERRHVQWFSLFGTALVAGTALMTWFLRDPPARFLAATADLLPGVSLFWLAPAGSDTFVCGRFVGVGVLLFWLLLAVTKVRQTWLQPAGRRWRFLASRRWLVPGLVGYLAAVPFAMLLHAVDYHPDVRQEAWKGLAVAMGAVLAGLLARWAVQASASPRPAPARVGLALGLLVLASAAATAALRLAAGPDPISTQLLPVVEQLPGSRFADWFGRRAAGDPALHAAALYLSAVTVTLFVLGVVVAFALRALDPRWAYNPALLLCLLVMLSDLTLGYFSYNVRKQATLVLLAAAALVAWNWGGVWWRHRYRFPNLEAHYDAPRPLAAYPRLPEGVTPVPLADDRAALAAHLDRLNGQKLVVVATSGGGIRAAVWTALLLETFDRRLPGWRERVRVVTGASGGMVGAALWAGSLRHPRPERRANRTAGFGALADVAGAAALRPLVQTMFLRDLSLALLWPPSARTTDRGRELEAQWELAAAEYYPPAANPFRATFADTLRAEAAGEHPSLVFTPAMVEDNRRCLVSNLDLDGFALPQGYSRSAYELFKLFPEAHATLTLSTAARMNATFPVVSPLVPLPTDPPRRLIDAGLYDNYGVEFLSGWLLAHQEALRRSAGVVLVEVRAFPLASRGLAARPDDPDMRAGDLLARLTEAAALVTGPLGALVRGRGNIMYHRNSAALAAAAAALGDRFERVTFELNEEASLNWYLSEQERESIAGYATAEPTEAELVRLAAALDIPPAN